jgi:superfamily II DNA or RNA helicase
MLPDETCHFLAADFDEEDWPRDSGVFKAVCRRHGIDAAIERSRSGRGAHAWIFFESPIKCSLARRLGSALLTQAMEERHDLSFSSYDRFFPNQDTMPRGGFGNLIALPLQGLARRDGNSLFVDEALVPYADQWAYLSGLGRLSAAQAEALAAKLCPAGELGVLHQDPEPEPAEKPWAKKSQAPPPPLAGADFPRVVRLTRANGVYLPKLGCSERALGRAKRLAAFKNPEFFKLQAQRMSTFQKPRIICSAWETADYVGLPRGLEGDLRALIEGAGASVELEDLTEAGRPIKASFVGELKEDQAQAAQALLAETTGVLSAATAFGKTVIAAYLIGSLKDNALILVHTQALMAQWKAALERFLRVEEGEPAPERPERPENPEKRPKGRGRPKERPAIGRLGGGYDDLGGVIDIAIVASLVADGEVKPLVKDYGLTIADECHHAAAVGYEAVLREAASRRVYGLTATPIRLDGHHPIIFQQCGPVRHKVDAKEQAEARGFPHLLIPRFTRFRKPASAPEDWPMAQIYSALAESPLRNELIIDDASEALERGRTPLVLTERVEHAFNLAAALRERRPGLAVHLLCGRGTGKEKRDALEALRSHPADEPMAIVATGKYAGEGFDEPRLDALFVTMPISWKGTVSQYVGRLHRIREGKSDVWVHDYVDVHVPVLDRMYAKRLAAYHSQGYKVHPSPYGEGQRAAEIFNDKNILSVFAQDLETAKKEIFIVSPFVSDNRVRQTLVLLEPSLESGLPVTVLTRPPEEAGLPGGPDLVVQGGAPEGDPPGLRVSQLAKELANAGVKVLLRESIHQKFAIIDRRVVWYGSMNLLSYGKSEETMMRFESREIAEELLDEIGKGLENPPAEEGGGLAGGAAGGAGAPEG